jgi:[acyl-carrier-protein] S-malonyltransferase
MKTAWVFAGHGAQYVGMGRAILHETAVGRSWLAAAEAVSGLKLGRLASQGPARALTDPCVLEPLLAAVAGAHSELLQAEEGPPAAVAGYSAGHVAALYAAGVMDRQTCLQVACVRGAALARAAARVPGGMVGVHGLPEDQLAWLAEDDDAHPATVAARNGPTHVVFSGTTLALSRAASRASAAGAATAPLDVAGPWHSHWLEPEVAEIAAAIASLTFRPAFVPVWSTVTGLATQDPESLRWTLAASVAAPIEWHATVMAMCASGLDAFVEVSPGRSLWGLLGQLPPPHGFARRYVESVRGPTALVLTDRRKRGDTSKGGVWGRGWLPRGRTSEEQESA